MDEIQTMHPSEPGRENKNNGRNAFLSWLQWVGLDFNPFEHLDAGSDPNIPLYLVGRDEYENLLSCQPAFVFAPPGGGKTAFRVRLANGCRSGETEVPVLPAIYLAPAPVSQLPKDPEIRQEQIFKTLSRAIAQELFLYLPYHPLAFERLTEEQKSELRRHLDCNLATPTILYLEELAETHSLEPLLKDFDPTARSLPNPPGAEDLEIFCKQMRAVHVQPYIKPEAVERFEMLLHFLKETMQFKALFLLVDGVDAYFETANHPDQAFSSIQWLLERCQSWMDRSIYLKFFLPLELETEIASRMPDLLTSPIKSIKIKWNEDSLIRIIRERLQVASGGRFDSLDAISSVSLRGAESIIVRNAKPFPRKVIQLTNHLLHVHVQQYHGRGKLEAEDLRLALNWYKERESRMVPDANS
jgi:hypothetical protein